MKTSVWFLFLLSVLTAGCTTTERTEGQQLPYFDLSGYIGEIISDSLSYRVEKSITINGETETQKLDHYPLWRDIQNFDAFDINRPALFDKYSIDTTRLNDTLKISCLPLDDKLKVTRMKVSQVDDHVTAIQIQVATKSFLEEVQLDINWKPSEGYILHRQTEKIFGSPSSQLVQVKILR
jgi:hypothetical protein